VSGPGYYRYRHRPTSQSELRRRWLFGVISEVHLASRGTYGYRRIHAEMTMAMDICVSSRLVSVLMTRAEIHGLPGPTRIKRLRGVVTAGDLVNRKFHRLHPNEFRNRLAKQQPTGIAPRRIPLSNLQGAINCSAFYAARLTLSQGI
jgi:putative transposase